MKKQDAQPDISIIIVTYNSNDYIEACLRSIARELQPYHYEVIVVDNASQQPLPAIESIYNHVQVIQNPINAGFARANNTGMRHASGKILWLLNPDTVLLPGCVPAALHCLQRSPQVGIVGTRLLNADQTIQNSLLASPNVFIEALRIFFLPGLLKLLLDRCAGVKGWMRKRRIAGFFSAETIEQPVEVQQMLGASLLLKREMVQAIGMFNEQFFMYMEEADLCVRARRAGWKMLYCPSSLVTHYGGHATWNEAETLSVERIKSNLLFFALYYPHWQVMLYRIVIFLTALSHLLLVPTPFYRFFADLAVGGGIYKGKDAKIAFSRRAALRQGGRLISTTFSPGLRENRKPMV